MLKRFIISLTIAGMVLLTANQALAKPYIGLGMGVITSDVDMNTTFKGRGVLTSFKIRNDTTQKQGAILAGYQYDFNDFFLAAEGHAELALGRDDIKDIKIDISPINNLKTDAKKKNSYGFDLRPGFHINSDIDVFALIGYRSTEFSIDQEAIKLGENNIDTEQFADLNGPELGLGIQFNATPHFAVRARFVHTDYDTIDPDIKSGNSLFFETGKFELSTNETTFDFIYTF